MFLTFLILVCVALFVLGPRPKVDLTTPIKPGRFGANLYSSYSETEKLKKIQAQLAEIENFFPAVPKGAEKAIIFNNEHQPTKTDYCVLYLHGFSATRQEITPVPENIAKHFNANYHATRITGHGLTGDELAKATPYDWMYDALEAWQIAEQLGKKVIIICTSTGGTLATWLSQQPQTQGKLASLVMISPNFGPKHWAMPLFQMPWSRYWIPLISKGVHSWEPSNEAGATYWTYSYPTSIVHDMNAFVKAVCKSKVEQINAPTLFIYSDHDVIVNSRKTDEVARRWGAEVKHRIAVPARANDNNHVITGDIVNPASTDMIHGEIASFLARHVIKH
ncbi:alpha/beta fold hydrolase [Reinekea marina]|uniref:Alpha/beta hydrolase n=1 Tax=Reinekea marina TaxID=1310421 RepID=A0ABV7WSV5_9GAMM|nr:alpha/beta fold hydrolase [Reinekea marina]MDN3649098.1 alpha/beta fold hydrolase [Reinekea marina]